MRLSVAALALIIAALATSGCSPQSTSDDEAEQRYAEPLPWEALASRATARDLTTKVPRTVRASCAELAVRASRQGTPRPVFCPPLVPDVETEVELAGGVETFARLDAGYVVGFWSPVTGLGAHWTISAGAGVPQRHYLQPNATSPADRPPASRMQLQGVTVNVYRVPARAPGFYSGHVVFEWQVGSTVFHLTMHGHRYLPQARLMAAALVAEVRACATEKARNARRAVCRLVFGRGAV
jgi:hypothetical protein